MELLEYTEISEETREVSRDWVQREASGHRGHGNIATGHTHPIVILNPKRTDDHKEPSTMFV